MKAPGLRRQPQLLQRRLGVDDDLAAVRKGELEKPAGAVDVARKSYNGLSVRFIPYYDGASDV